MKARKLLLTIILLLLYISLFALTINIPEDYSTIQEGIDAANEGDIILVASGTYVENINFGGKNITVTSTNGAEETIIDGTNETEYASVVKFVNGETSAAVLDGFTITNGLNQYGSGIYCEAYSSPTLSNLIICNNEAYYGEGGGIYCNYYSSPTLENIIIKDNIAAVGGAGLYAEYYSNPILNNILIVNNSVEGMKKSANRYLYGGGIYCMSNSSLTLENVTFYGNHSFYGGAIYCGYGSDAELKNCILWNDDPDEIGTPTLVNATYSDIQGGFDGSGNINADPLFVDAENGDFSLEESSPCIGTGENGADMGFSYSTAEIIYGDVNGDENVSSYDAALTLQYSAGLISDWTEEQITAGDVNGDENISSYDAALILQYSAGLIDEFPVEGK